MNNGNFDTNSDTRNFDPDSMLGSTIIAVEEEHKEDPYAVVRIIYTPTKTAFEQKKSEEKRENAMRSYMIKYGPSQFNSGHPNPPPFKYEDESSVTYVVSTFEINFNKDEKSITVAASDITIDMLKGFQETNCELTFRFGDERFLHDGNVKSFIYSKEKHSVPTIKLHLK